MDFPRPLRAALPFGLLLLAAAALPRPALAEDGCTASGCHSDKLAGATVHAVAESCDTCHQATAEGHPQKGRRTFSLLQAEPALCGDCHEVTPSAAHVHAPFADGSCTTCHDPHASAQPKLLTASAGELCAGCHGEQEATHLHGPVAAGDCTSCHAAHESANPTLLVAAGEAVCFACHTDLQGMPESPGVHAAVAAGCTSCHDPHGSEQPKLLAQPGQSLCFECHTEVGETVQQAKVAHAPVASEQGCASCHSPHASPNPSLLLAAEKDTCTSCHSNVLTRSMTTLHGPIAAGSCTTCHRPHGGGEAKLLAGAFPATPYAPWDEAAYGLCFECHDADLARYPDTSFATGFRDGDRNLHWVHVNGGTAKGRTCRLCHDMHGAGNDKLLAETVRFGQWNLPLRFAATATGGGCSPGCHRPYQYDREKPVGTARPAAVAGGRNP